MSALDPRIRALVEAARAAEPTAADRARVRAALALRFAPSMAPPHASPGGSLAAPAGAGAKLLAAGLLIGAAGFGAGLFVGRTSAPGAVLARHGLDVQAMESAHVVRRATEGAQGAALPGVDEPVAALGPMREAAPIAAHAVATRNLPRRVAARPLDAQAPAEPSVVSSLTEETELLRAAQMSLGAGDATAALARLDELGARHPDGMLREDRLAARIVALCAAGRDAEARREAERFLVEAPLSIHAARVRASCAFATRTR